MFVAKVTGSVVSTEKVESMKGQKLLVVEPYRLDTGSRDKLVTTGRTFVAVDALGAGVGDMVLISQASSARFNARNQQTPHRYRRDRHRRFGQYRETIVYSRAHDNQPNT